MKLTTQQITKLESLEKIIEKGEKTFVEVGLALTEIKEQKLYLRDYDNFETYCQERWGWGQRRGYQLMNAANVVKSLPLDCEPLVHTERDAREIAKLPQTEQAAAVQEATKTGETIAATVKKKLVMPPLKPKEEPEAILDMTGFAIPKQVMDVWNRKEEIQYILTQLSTLKGVLRGAQETSDVLFVEVDFSTTLADLDRVWKNVQCALPYAVCPTCQGKVRDTCRLCGGRGMISKHRWSNVVPRETKELRFKVKQ